MFDFFGRGGGGGSQLSSVEEAVRHILVTFMCTISQCHRCSRQPTSHYFQSHGMFQRR